MLLMRKARTSRLDTRWLNWISKGIYDEFSLPFNKTSILLRKPNDKDERPSYALHRDKFPMATISCPINDIDARTNFLDMRHVMKELTPEEKMAVTIGGIPRGEPPMTLATYEQKILSLPIGKQPLHHGIQVMERDGANGINTNKAAIDKFNHLISEHSSSVIMKPGSMMIWHNGMIYHEASPIENKAPSADVGKYARIAVYTSAGSHEIVR